MSIHPLVADVSGYMTRICKNANILVQYFRQKIYIIYTIMHRLM